MWYEALWFPEVESSRTQFNVLCLGLKACKSSKMPCLWLEDSTVFWLAENLRRSWALLEHARELANFQAKIFFFMEIAQILRKICDFLSQDLFYESSSALCPWSFGIERVCPRKVCPWPRIFLCPRLHLWWFRSENWGVELTNRCFIFMYLQKTIRRNNESTTEEEPDHFPITLVFPVLFAVSPKDIL